MSAWFVGTDHVDAILSWLDTCYRYSVPLPNGEHQQSPSPEEWTEIGKALLAENIASLRARYPDDWQEMVDIDVNKYRYRHDAHFVTSTRNLAITVIKLIDCLDYQSCEHEGWRDSWAKRFCDFVIGAATSKVPGYEDAPWGYNKPADAPQVIRLSDLVH
jgi:hypothetical protein